MKRSLQSKLVFGSSSIAWSSQKLRLRCSEFLSQLASRSGVESSILVNDDRFQQLRSEGPEHWQEIFQLGKQLENLDATLILQGSQADGTTTPFSDIDLILFGNPSNPQQICLARRLGELVTTIDPLQHHGVFFYDIGSVIRYSESVLPLATLEKSTCVFDSFSNQFQVLNDRYAPAMTLRHFTSNLQSFLERPIVRGLWDWKFRVSQFLLIPCLLAAVFKNFMYKGDSFTATSQLYSTESWAAIEMLSTVRLNWPLNSDSAQLNNFPFSADRALGKSANDPWPVPDSLALWNEGSFQSAARMFLRETLQLAGLN